MADREVGYVELTATTRIIFAVGSWKGQSRASIRKFVSTEKYSGPTKSGMSLDGTTVVQLLTALRTLQSAIPAHDQNQYVSIGKAHDWEIRITVIPPDEDSQLPSVDIREYVESPNYTGPTKAGVRFPWNLLRQFSQFVEVLVRQLGVAVSSEPNLFPDIQPNWVTDARETLDATGLKPTPPGLEPAGIKPFPEGFVPECTSDVEILRLPASTLKTVQDRSGYYFVTDDADFRHQVRNEVEGKFFIYARKRGVIELSLPKEMFRVFSAVVKYEAYCRELRQKIIHDIETRSRNHTLAEYMARETLETSGLPIC